MTRDPNRLVLEWLDEGPSQAADRLVSATLTAVHATPQRRPLTQRLFRRGSVGRAWSVAAVAAVLAVVVAGFALQPREPGMGGTPSPTSSVPTSAGPAVVPSDWPLHSEPADGYSIRYPPGWTVTSVSEPWPLTSGRPEEFGDSFTSADAQLLVASQQRGFTQSGNAWVANYHERLVAEVGEACAGGTVAEWEGVIVGQRRGLLSARCPSTVLEVVTYAGNRGYVLRFTSSGTEADVRAQLDVFLSAIAFAPVAEGPPAGASPSP